MLLDNPNGNFKFIRGYGLPFSSGALASPGFEIVHATFKPLARLADGYRLIERQLSDAGRPINAVCGIELRIPAPLTPAGFDEFNRGYIERLTAWDVMIDGLNPIARTNVAPAASPIGEPSLHGFYYTAPAMGAARPAFVLAGVPEVASREGGKREIAAAGDVSTEGLRRKNACVLEALGGLLREMNLGWSEASAVNLYTVHDMHPLFATDLLPALGAGAYRGIRWHYARPPVIGLELEIDGYAARQELVLAP
ncbi:MAG: 2-amino-5-chloromuconate deaminase CnbZ [Candidatus Binataceae bacterium]